MSYIQTLRDEFSAGIPYSWRLQSLTKDKKKGIFVPYIEARDVFNRLDSACKFGWETSFKEIAGHIFGGIGVVMEDRTVIWKWDTGMRVETDPGNKMYDQGAKGSASDSLKRAAVQWGIGRFLYELKPEVFPVDDYKNPLDSNGARIYDIGAHIKSKGKASTPIAEKPASDKPALDEAKLEAMVGYINSGKVKLVEDSMSKYTLTEGQKKTLTTLISSAKAKASTKAVLS